MAARDGGAEKVVIIERAEQLGGLLPQCTYNGFGLLYFKRVIRFAVDVRKRRWGS